VTSVGEFVRDFGLRDQVRRAAVSIPSNIAEGFERGGDKEFRQFLAHAKGSTGELKTHLYIALDVGFIDHEQFNPLYAQASEIGRILGGLMRYLSQSSLCARKYR
jgi:four helix bundle protein